MKAPARLGLGAVALVVVAIAAVTIKDAADDEVPGMLWRDASVTLQPVRALKGVVIGQNMEEVTARMGRFDLKPKVTAAEVASPGSEYQQAGGGQLRLRVEEGRVRRVSYECRGPDATRVNRIACNDPSARVVEVFGGGARQLCAKVPASDPAAAVAPGVFFFDVLDTGTRYVTVQGEVKGFIIMAPADLEQALGGDQLWQRCS
jgi:hypothetical protein